MHVAILTTYVGNAKRINADTVTKNNKNENKCFNKRALMPIQGYIGSQKVVDTIKQLRCVT